MPKTFDPESRELFLAHLRAGMRRGAASELLGFERHEVDGYIADHPEFALQTVDAEKDACEHVEEALYQAAVSGNVVACKLWLERAESRRTPEDPRPPSPTAGGGGVLGSLIDEAEGDGAAL